LAIEKMSAVSIEGPLRRTNKTLVKCCESNCFQIVSSAHNSNEYYSSQSLKTLRDKNVFAPLVKRGLAIAECMEIKIRFADYEDIDLNVSIDFSDYFGEIEHRLFPLAERKKQAEKQIEEYSQALAQVEHLRGLSSKFEEIFAMRYIKVRFGRLPMQSQNNLKYFEDKNFCFIPFESRDDFAWGVYFVPETEAAAVDDIFKSINFERIRVPDYFKGSADDTKAALLSLIEKETETMNAADREIAEIRETEGENFLKIFCRLKALDESHELRTNVAVMNNRFYISGFIPTRKKDEFVKSIEEDGGGVTVQIMPDGSVPEKPPVLLRNNRLFRPFEMFVKMYGLPEYGEFDPTPLVAVSFMLIYGIMFGDLGQGLVISVLGLILSFWKKAALGPVMTRIGISSAIFGTLYGSVFGMEHLIRPFFRIPRVYEFLGLGSPPEDVFGISTFILIGALILGVIIVIGAILLNILINIKRGDLSGALLGASGLTGFVLYTAVIVAAGLRVALNVDVLVAPYIICLIILPALSLFFKEPLSELIARAGVKKRAKQINSNTALINAIKARSDALINSDAESEVKILSGDSNYTITDLMQCRYIKTRFGRLKYEEYIKADEKSKSEGEFFFFPYEIAGGDITGFYAAPLDYIPHAERYFDALGFVAMKPPSVSAPETAKAKESAEHHVHKSDRHGRKKKPVGEFIIEGVIELFENALTYITNTMSFLRVGGFILSHAGMMLVVSILSKGFTNIPAMIIGNILVIGIEGFIVGIQVLRLEFYEMFSRYYKGGGAAFKPIVIDLNIN